MRTFKANQRKANNHRASGRRIAQEIEIIRAALKRRGYRIRKQPKQAAWAVTPLSPPLPRGETGGSDKFYLLTFQPAPISAWVLHPQDNDASRDTLSNIIQRALTQQPATKTRRNS